MRTLTVILFIVTTMLLSSCGTIFLTQNEVPALTIESNVPNAEVYLNGKYVGITPYSHFGEKCDVKKITVKKKGYKEKSVNPRKLNSCAYLNFLLPTPAFIWGYFVDKSKPKCWYYKSDTFYFQLEME